MAKIVKLDRIIIFIGGTLESPWGLRLVFCPTIVAGGEKLRMVLLPLYECILSGVENQR